MVSANEMYSNQQLRQIITYKPRLLLITDSNERLSKLRSLLNPEVFDITNVSSSEGLDRACLGQHCIAVIDVGPDRIIEVLSLLRGSKEHTMIPLLVEASRISTEQRLAGVLPQFRAMPFCHHELVTLTRFWFSELTPAQNDRGIL